MILLCEICQQPIAKFDPKQIKYPLNEAMFQPVTQDHPIPFQGQQAWENFLCPHCRFSPFTIPDSGQEHPVKLFVAVANDGTWETVEIPGIEEEVVDLTNEVTEIPRRRGRVKRH